ncbi:nucleoside phosphorylase [Thermodesulfobacteriota bacterium]
MKKHDDAIISPVNEGKKPDLGPLAVLVATKSDLELICSRLSLNKERFKRLWTSRLFVVNEKRARFAVSGPMIGAPYAAMILEAMIARGVRKIVFVGWCGAVSPEIKIGDIVVPTAALIDEGTSLHYEPEDELKAIPSGNISTQAKSVLKKQGLDFHEGSVWTTDAPFRETPETVKKYQQRNVLAVEMELSALFTVARYRQVDIGAILVVSDEISSYTWKPGFKEAAFNKSRQDVSEIISHLLGVL